jgi:hypothetical protein
MIVKGRMTKLRVLLGVGMSATGLFMGDSIARAGTVPTVPFTEEFVADEAGWHDVSLAPLGWISSGGPDGSSYASMTFNFVSSASGDAPALFRAQDKWTSSGGAFEGDYTDVNANLFKVYVRHNAGVPLSYFARFSSPFNFPGAIAVAFAPVPSGVWTELEIPIHNGSANLISFEGTDYQSVFTNVGHVQIGLTVPSSLAGVDQEFTFDIDKVTIANNPVPAVSEWGLAVMALITVTAGTLTIRRRSSLVVVP